MGGRAGACMPIWMHGHFVGSFLLNRGLSMTLKQSLAGAVAFVALASAAGAADMQPVLKAPAVVEQQATGYVEIYSGWAGTRETRTNCSPCESNLIRLDGWALGGAA